MKIATWNVNSLRVRLPHVLEWLQINQPDVLALQETKSVDEQFPAEELQQAGYYSVYSGQKTYNGVALLSRKPHDNHEVVTDFPDFDDPQRRIMAASFDGVRILNLYVPNGASVDSEKYQYKLNWFSHLLKFVKNEQSKYQNMIILGDFNIAPADIDVHDPAAWEGNVLVSPKEREAFHQLLTLGFSDSFRLHESGQFFSWWDYRAAAYRRNHGLRIDHILLGNSLVTHCKKSNIDVEPRKWERPSDHAPVMVTLAWPL